MSTRAVIARKTQSGFTGRYHHWDGYPSALGATLFTIYQGHFDRDLPRMLKYLLDDHPAGWSTINDADFALEAGYDLVKAPQCYCHGGRSEKGCRYTEANAQASGCEWAYVFDGSQMLILSSYHPDGGKMIGMFGCGNPDAKWYQVAAVDLDGAEPDWEAIEKMEPVVPVRN